VIKKFVNFKQFKYTLICEIEKQNKTQKIIGNHYQKHESKQKGK